MIETDTVESPALACELTALSPQERDRHASLWEQVQAIAPDSEPTGTGIAFRFANRLDLAHDLVELAALEQRCCPFLRVVLAFEPDGESLTLELAGDDRVRDFLAGDVLPG